MADLEYFGDFLKSLPRLICIYIPLSEGLRELFGSHHGDFTHNQEQTKLNV